MAEGNWLMPRDTNALPSFDSSWAAGADSTALSLAELKGAIGLARAKGLVTLADEVDQAVVILGDRIHAQMAVGLHSMVMRVVNIENKFEQEWMQEFTAEHLRSIKQALYQNQATTHSGLNRIISDSMRWDEDLARQKKWWQR